MRQLLLIRHCQSVHAQERYIGKTDTPLTELGRMQARQVGRRLEKLGCREVLSSPALRAKETVRNAECVTELTVGWDEGLREIDFGRWEGLSFEEIAARDPELVTEWAQNRMDFCFPEGEALSAFWERVRRAGDRVAALPQERLAVVTHGGVIRFLLCHFLGLEPGCNRLFRVEPGTVTSLLFQDGVASLTGLNDGCHLEVL